MLDDVLHRPVRVAGLSRLVSRVHGCGRLVSRVHGCELKLLMWLCDPATSAGREHSPGITRILERNARRSIMETRRIILPSTAIVVSAALILGGGTTAQAAQTDQSSRDIACQSSVLQDHGVDVDLLCKIVEIGDFLEFAQDGKSIAVTLTDDDLSERFGFTPTQITDLHAILNGSYQPHQPVAKLYQDRAARFYISNDDLKAGTFAILATAASSSPEALAAAMVGWSDFQASSAARSVPH